MSARTISIILGVLLLAAGVLGFVPPQYQQNIVGADGIFKVDLAHNLVHLASGLLLILLPSIIGGRQTLLLLGVVYAAVAALGLMNPNDNYLISNQYIAMNQADRWLHVALAVILILAGLVFSNRTHDDA